MKKSLLFVVFVSFFGITFSYSVSQKLEDNSTSKSFKPFLPDGSSIQLHNHDDHAGHNHIGHDHSGHNHSAADKKTVSSLGKHKKNTKQTKSASPLNGFGIKRKDSAEFKKSFDSSMKPFKRKHLHIEEEETFSWPI